MSKGDYNCDRRTTKILIETADLLEDLLIYYSEGGKCNLLSLSTYNGHEHYMTIYLNQDSNSWWEIDDLTEKSEAINENCTSVINIFKEK